MAEQLRREKETYFFWLARDITRLIDRLVRPIDAGTVERLKKIEGHLTDLSAGQEVVTLRSDQANNKTHYEYRSLTGMETVLNYVSLERFSLYYDLRAPGDPVPIYSDGQIIYIGEKEYCLTSHEEKISCLPYTDKLYRTCHEFDSDNIVRGANGLIYYAREATLCCFHIDDPTNVQSLVLDIQPKHISRIHACLSQPILIIECEKIYRWSIKTNQFKAIAYPFPYTPLDYNDQRQLYLDPLNGCLYFVSNWGGLKIIHEDGQLLLDIEADHHNHVPEERQARLNVHWLYITLGGQLIISISIDGYIHSYLYG